MTKNCAFTICAKNYLGLAFTLKESFLEHNKNSEFFIFVADEMDLTHENLDSIFIAKEVLSIDPEKWINMAFKYEITEFCTSIKPHCFCYLFDNLSFDKVVYLDPDTFVFSNFSYIFTNLDKYLFITTPHILTPISSVLEKSIETGDRGFLRVGINNFGFVAIMKSKKTLEILNWWKYKLENDCFDERLIGTFTDQKWMEYLPAFLDNNEYLCSKNKGLNIAPWNYFERKVLVQDNIFYVENRIDPLNSTKDKLILAHFAGYNYKKLIEGSLDKRIRIKNLKEYPDLALILEKYIKSLGNNNVLFFSYINQNYSYNTFENGITINVPHRRLYNALYSDFNYRDNPFLNGKKSLFDLFDKNKLIDKSKAVIKMEKLNPDDITNYGQKISWLYFCMRSFARVIGFRNYITFLRLMRHLCMYENQVFLLGKIYNRDKFTK